MEKAGNGDFEGNRKRKRLKLIRNSIGCNKYAGNPTKPYQESSSSETLEVANGAVERQG